MVWEPLDHTGDQKSKQQEKEQPIEKIVPSALERGVDRLVAQWIAPRVPQGILPNQITIAGFLLGLIAALGLFCLGAHRGWVGVVVAALLANTLADSLDGAIARQRGLTSERGFFLDHLLDQLTFNAWFLAVGLANYALFPIAVMGALVANLHLILDLYWVHLRGRFPLPRIGPIEIRLTALGLAVLTAIWPAPVVTLGSLGLGWFDLVNGIAVPISFVEFVLSAASLYQQLAGYGEQ